MKNAAPMVLLSFACLNCGVDYLTGDCSAIAVPALVVTVVDGAMGQRICDAMVVAVEGSFSSRLEPFLGGEMCRYSGPYERAGVYEVRVTREGYAPAVVGNVRVSADECHVITRSLTVTLTR